MYFFRKGVSSGKMYETHAEKNCLYEEYASKFTRKFENCVLVSSGSEMLLKNMSDSFMCSQKLKFSKRSAEKR